jgi:hypothetical protein
MQTQMRQPHRQPAHHQPLAPNAVQHDPAGGGNLLHQAL